MLAEDKTFCKLRMRTRRRLRTWWCTRRWSGMCLSTWWWCTRRWTGRWTRSSHVLASQSWLCCKAGTKLFAQFLNDALPLLVHFQWISHTITKGLMFPHWDLLLGSLIYFYVIPTSNSCTVHLEKVFNVHCAVTSIITPIQSVACFIAAADSSTRWSVRCARVCTRVVFEESTRVLQCTERCFPLCTVL